MNRRGAWDFHFWRDRTREADFLLHRAGTFHLADAKWTELPDARDVGGLRRVARELPDGAVRSVSVFCRTPNAFPLGVAIDGGRAVPLDEREGLSDWA